MKIQRSSTLKNKKEKQRKELKMKKIESEKKGLSMYRCRWCDAVHSCDWGKCGNCKLICPSIDQFEIKDFCNRCKPKNKEEENEIENYLRKVQEIPLLQSKYHHRHCPMPVLRKPKQHLREDADNT